MTKAFFFGAARCVRFLFRRAKNSAFFDEVGALARQDWPVIKQLVVDDRWIWIHFPDVGPTHLEDTISSQWRAA